MKPTENYDLFISYARRDNQPGADHTGFIDAFVQGIIAEHRRFTSSDLHIFFDREAIRSMDDWSHRLLEGLRHSRLLLAFLSPNYFASKYCRWEWEHYLRHEQGQSLTGRGIAPIYFAEVPGFESGDLASAAREWLDDLKRRQFVDLREWSRNGVEALREGDVRRRMEALSLSISDRLEIAERAERSIGLVARHNQHFVGRREEIRRLREVLAMGRMGVIAAVHGLGGIGKTALAVEYAHAYAGDYSGGRWTLECEGIADLSTAFLQLAAPLGIDLTPDEKREPAAGFARVLARLRELAHSGIDVAPDEGRKPTAGFARVLGRLRKFAHGDGVQNSPKGNQSRPACLIILDNVSEPALLSQTELARLPAEDWLHILATTRLGPADLGKNTSECDFVSLDELPVRDAVDLIRSHQPGGRFANPADEAIAHTIAVDLGGFTLAVEAAAVFLGIHSGEVGFEDFLARLREEGVAATDAVASETTDGVATSIRHRGKQLSAVILPMISRLDAVETGALEWAALLPPDCVVLPWIKDLLAVETPSLASPAKPGYPDPWHRAVRRLTGWMLFSASHEPALDSKGTIRLVRMHRLVGEILRQRARNARPNAVRP